MGRILDKIILFQAKEKEMRKSRNRLGPRVWSIAVITAEPIRTPNNDIDSGGPRKPILKVVLTTAQAGLKHSTPVLGTTGMNQDAQKQSSFVSD